MDVRWGLLNNWRIAASFKLRLVNMDVRWGLLNNWRMAASFKLRPANI